MSIVHSNKRDLIVNRDSAVRIAARIFMEKTRTTKVIIQEYTRNITIEYTGSRKELDYIKDNLVITKVFAR